MKNVYVALHKHTVRVRVYGTAHLHQKPGDPSAHLGGIPAQARDAPCDATSLRAATHETTRLVDRARAGQNPVANKADRLADGGPLGALRARTGDLGDARGD